MKLHGLILETVRYDETREFYARLLATQPEEADSSGQRSATFELPGGAPTLVILERSEGARGLPAVRVELTFDSGDREAARTAAARHGLALERQPDSTLRATDPAGNAVTLR